MPKRSVKDYRPTGVPLHASLVSEEQIDALIVAVGAPLPRRMFEEHLFPEGDASKVKQLTARQFLRQRVESAALNYVWEAQQKYRPTAAQLAKDFAEIEKRAKRLLIALQVTTTADFEKMPFALRFGGLSAIAHGDAKSRRQLHGPISGDGLLRQVVQGIGDLSRWANVAHDRETQRHLSRIKSMPHHAGDAPFNEYLGRVIADGWCQVWGKETLQTPRLYRYMMAAAVIVGKRLTEEGARTRLKALYPVKGRKSVR